MDEVESIWAHVEIMGHRVRVGQLREVTRFGRTMIEVTVPELPEVPATSEPVKSYDKDFRLVNGISHIAALPAVPAQTEWYSPEALFCIREITEAAAWEMLDKARTRPWPTFIPDPLALFSLASANNSDPFPDSDPFKD